MIRKWEQSRGASATATAITVLAALLTLAARPTQAGLDLSRAVTTRLDNGLTLVVLEEHSLPLVSVQMLYTVGARDEPIGKTGIAHFLEHMAFRATENFPDTDVVSAIYAVGGEWHGYTWLDQTTYFETVPAEHLDLALRIEADRMFRLEIPEADLRAEQGAVLAEMHGYENDPATRLKDAVLGVSFLQHTYRNNSIGWESDVKSIGHEDLVDFYRRHYRPANAVLAVVGSADEARVRARVEELFGGYPAEPASLPPPTVEPPQIGLRRIELSGPGDRDRFEVAYRAPGVSDPAFAGFLLLQKILGGGSGINFAQNEWGDSAPADSRLGKITDDLVTWFIPTEFPYVFTVAGSIGEDTSQADLEGRLESAFAALRDRPPGPAELEQARRQVLDDLLFDVETTEDAAHQLAYFAGIGSPEVLLRLPEMLEAVTPEAVQQIARRYLKPEQRTSGWYRARETADPEAQQVQPDAPAPPLGKLPATPAPGPATVGEVGSPELLGLRSGIPVLFQRLSLTRTAHLRILLPTTRLELDPNAETDDPVWRHTALSFRFRPETLESVAVRARRLLDEAQPQEITPSEEIQHPSHRLRRELDAVLGADPLPVTNAPVAISLVGDLEERDALEVLERAFAGVAPADTAISGMGRTSVEKKVTLATRPAQAQLGYVAIAPPPTSAEAMAWRFLLYILSHGYEGRLGKEAITRRGLVYYIGSRYATDGTNGRISLEIGVDPDKLDAMRKLLDEMLLDLQSNPPTATELAEAKQHFIGRRASAAQSNDEVSSRLLDDWLGHGRPLGEEEFAALVNGVTLADLEAVLPSFLAGSTITVTH